ncbi:MAG: hypothetical protein AB7P17_11440 [Nitrospirales bacterium]|nr:hypothetical protein [Nitrospirales bacterium]
MKIPKNHSFNRTPEKSLFERVGLFIIGVLFLLFAIEYVEKETMAENLSAFHWILH